MNQANSCFDAYLDEGSMVTQTTFVFLAFQIHIIFIFQIITSKAFQGSIKRPCSTHLGGLVLAIHVKDNVAAAELLDKNAERT